MIDLAEDNPSVCYMILYSSLYLGSSYSIISPYLSHNYLLLKNLAEELNLGSVCIHYFYLLYDTNIATSLINYHFQKRNQVGKNCEGKLYLHHHHHLHHLQQLQSNISQVFDRYHRSPGSLKSSQWVSELVTSITSRASGDAKKTMFNTVIQV